MDYKEQKSVETLKNRLALVENTIALLNAEINDPDLEFSKKEVQEKNKEIKYNNDLAKRLSDELAQIYKVINQRKKEEIAAKEEYRKRENQKKVEFFYEYLAHLGTLKDFKDVDPQMHEHFMKIRNFGPIRVAMRKLGLK